MRYVLGVLGVIFVAILAIVLIVSGPSKGSSGSSKNIPSKLAELAKPGSSVTLMTSGELVGDQDRRAIRIIISDSDRTIQLLSGYSQDVIKSKHYSNNSTAYQYLLAALDQAGFNLKQNTPLDERGACPNGDTYDYRLSDGSQDIISTWSTTCNDGQGNFAGDSESVSQLFQAQIPSYGDFASQVRF